MPNASHLRLLLFATLVSLIAAFGCAGDPDAEYAEFLESGKQFMESGEHARALIQFRNAVALKPEEAEAMFQLGRAYAAQRNYQQAYASFMRASTLDENHAGAQTAVSEILVALGDAAMVDDARSRLENILAANPDNTDARFVLAAAKAKTDREAAEEDLLQTLENYPTHLKSSVALAAIKLNERDFDGAREILERAVEEDPESAEPHIALGQFLLVTQETERAESEFEKALEIDPKNIGGLAAKARLLLIQDRREEAGELYKTISESNNKQYRAVYGRYLLGMRKFDEAVVEFERLHGLDKSDRDMRTALVATYRAAGRTEEAENLLSGVIDDNEQDYQARLQRAELRMADGDVDGAAEDVSAVLDVNDTSAPAHYLMARVYLAQGQRLQARQELNEVLRLDEKLVTPRIELANLLVTERNSDAALNLLTTAPEPGSAGDKLRLAVALNWVELQMGAKENVRARLDEVAPQYPNSPDLKLQDGILVLDAAARSKSRADFEKARAIFTEVLAVNPNEVRAVNGLGWSYTGLGENQTSNAIAAVKKHVDSAPPSAVLASTMAAWYIQTGDVDAASTYLNKAIEVNPGYIPAQLELAKLDVRENREGPALQRLNDVVAAMPTNIEAQVMLGQLHEKLGNISAAMDSYRAIIQADTDNFRALNNLAYHLANDPATIDEALGYAQRAKEAAPENLFVDDTIGWCYYKKGNFRTAAEYFQRAADGLSLASVKYHLAMAYAQTGEVERAKAAFAEAKQMDPQAEEAEAAEVLIARLGGN